MHPSLPQVLPSFALEQELTEQLQELDEHVLRRQLKTVQTPCSPETIINGNKILSFASNDYLGLANHPRLIQAAQEGAAQWGVGAGASHLVSGHTAVHQAFDTKIATFTGMESAISFSTGYMANIAVMPALLTRGDEIFADRVNHASLIDGAVLSRAELRRYPHSDVQMLAAALSASRAKRKLIVTDSVFSMDGDIAPLAQLLELAKQHQAWLLVDDAHGFGVLGQEGRGALHEAALTSPQLILMGTLGKAVGVSGAFVAGSHTLIEFLIQKARPYIFTTATPPLLAHTLLTAIDLVEQADAARAHLQALICHLQQQLQLKRWQLLPSRTAIQPIVIGDNTQTISAAKALYEQGIWTPAIRPPSVPAGSARLRVSLSASHTFEQVERLANALNQLESKV